MKILVTGGCGFIGSHFIRVVLSEHPDWDILNLDALTYAGNLLTTMDFQTSPHYRFIYGSITNKELLERLIPGVDAVVNFAAETHVDRSIADVEPFIMTNILGTQRLIDVCRKNGTRFHHVSTDEVFGSLGPDDPKFNEFTPYDPRNPYSATKAASDHLVRAALHTHGLKATISNCTNNYGTHLYPEKFLAIAVTNVIDGKPIVIHGDGQQKRDWIHARDHARGILSILLNGKIGETYMMAGDTDITIADTGRLLLKVMGLSDNLLVFMNDRPGQDRRYAIDHGKIERELGWTPQVSLEQGLAEMVDWYRRNQDWWRPIKDSAGYCVWYKEQVQNIKNQI
ncbi:MAG: dTDP-glucose 4,6-dehydratase [Candidatus Uhrbacteria bacterium]